MAVFVAVSAVALVFQAAMLFGVYKATATLRDKVLTTLPKVEALLESSRTTVEEARVTLIEVRVKSTAILDAGQKQMKQLEALLNDASERTSRQMAYAEAVVEDTLNRVESTVNMVHSGVLKPIRGINGLAAGVSAAIQYLLNRKNNPRRATLDEEMFI